METPSKRPMTAFAQAVLAASDLIRTRFEKTEFTGAVLRTVSVEAPQVESTGGGKQARESIVLKPQNGDSSQAITAGFIDVGLRAAEMRSYAAITMLYQQRHKAPLDLPEGEYNRFLEDLQGLLSQEGYVFKLVDAQEQLQKVHAADGPPPKGNNNVTMFFVGAIGALIVVALAIVLLLK